MMYSCFYQRLPQHDTYMKDSLSCVIIIYLHCVVTVMRAWSLPVNSLRVLSVLFYFMYTMGLLPQFNCLLDLQ